MFDGLIVGLSVELVSSWPWPVKKNMNIILCTMRNLALCTNKIRRKWMYILGICGLKSLSKLGVFFNVQLLLKSKIPILNRVFWRFIVSFSMSTWTIIHCQIFAIDSLSKILFRNWKTGSLEIYLLHSILSFKILISGWALEPEQNHWIWKLYLNTFRIVNFCYYPVSDAL